MVTPTPPWLRAEVLRVLHKATHGAPVVSVEQLAGCGYLTKRDLRFMQLADDDDIGLINECLLLEDELREQEFAALGRLLVHARSGQGELDDRLLALPRRQLARAAIDLYELGWVTDEC